MPERRMTILDAIIPMLALAFGLALAVYIIQATGVNPFLAGIMAVEMFGLVIFEGYLRSKGFIKRPEDRAYFYMGALSFVLLTYGLVQAGIIPIPSSTGAIPMSQFRAYAVFTATFWGIIAFMGFTLGLFIYWSLKKAGYVEAPRVRYVR